MGAVLDSAQPLLRDSHLLSWTAIIRGKVHHFVVYLQCDVFDTPENRVITSGLTLASLKKAVWLIPAIDSEKPKYLANNCGRRFAIDSR